MTFHSLSSPLSLRFEIELRRLRNANTTKTEHDNDSSAHNFRLCQYNTANESSSSGDREGRRQQAWVMGEERKPRRAGKGGESRLVVIALLALNRAGSGGDRLHFHLSFSHQHYLLPPPTASQLVLWESESRSISFRMGDDR